MLKGIRTLSVQLALFISSGSIRADELSSAVRNRMNIGEFEPMIIPEMAGMPDEFPSLQINTSEGYRLAMSKSRIDLFLALPLGIDDGDICSFILSCQSLMSILSEKKIVFSRVGFVRLFFIAQAKADFLIDELMKVSSDDICEVTISLTKKVICANKQSNNIFIFSTGQNDFGESGVAFNRDINTDLSDSSSLDDKEVIDYVLEASALTELGSLKDFIKV